MPVSGPPNSTSSSSIRRCEGVGQLELGERATPDARSASPGLRARPGRRGAAAPRASTAGSTRDPGGDGGADERGGRSVPVRVLSPRWAAPSSDQLPGAQRALQLVLDRQQATRAAAGAARSARCRGARRTAPDARSRRRSPAPRTSAPAHTLRALTTISAPPRRGRCSVPPTATSHRSRLAANARATACGVAAPVVDVAARPVAQRARRAGGRGTRGAGRAR